ncbi:MAG: calcium-translocating P-type ATPase, PMCA-type [Actinomycetota bacterium]
MANDMSVPVLPDGSEIDLVTGLTDEQVAASRAANGSNEFAPLPKKTLWDFVKASFGDPMLRILVVAAAVTMALGSRNGEYEDGIAITIAVIVVVLVGTFNELRAQRDYAALEEVSSHQFVRVVRGGHIEEVDTAELVVGDVVEVNLGDVLAADVVFASGNPLTVNEAQITGEPETKKRPGDPLFASSRVLDGGGRAVVASVGDDTVFGKIRSEIQEGDTATPLQERLESFAGTIGKIGTGVAVFTLVALVGSDLIRGDLDFGTSIEFWEAMVEYVTVAVTIVVVTVPEGLPLAVTLSLAYTTRRMAQEQALVRELSACETMGSATIVCTDKTGTLTLGHMDVARVWAGGTMYEAAEIGAMPAETLDLLARGIAVNSTADIVERDGERHVAGNSTEGALLMLLDSLGHDYLRTRNDHALLERVEFNSVRKYMESLVEVPGGRELHVKGAPEVVLERTGDAELAAEILGVVDDAAQRGYRTLGVAASRPDGDLEFLALVVLADPMRTEVPDSVERCGRAGVGVMMITGDIAPTAFEIARQAGIADDQDQVITGGEFRELTDEEASDRLRSTKVMARALPDDKSRVARLLQDQGEVVAMTGDGVNDAPALVASDVGFSMGSGSKVAREASDIVVVDDDFTTIVRAIRWGRAVFENIRKFLQFQLTVNVVALGVALTAALAGFGTPLNPVQLLWVNLIMDSFAAVALTLQRPSDSLYDQKPHGRSAPLVSKFMMINIGVASAFMFALLWVVLGTDLVTDTGREDVVRTTLVFNTFVFLQIFNAFNARAVRPGRNPLEGIFTAASFNTIMAIIVVMQAIIIAVGGSTFEVTPLSAGQWAASVGLGGLMIPVGFISRRIATAFAGDEE